MARSNPLYTVEAQYNLLSEALPLTLARTETLKNRLLIACSSGGTLEQAKNRLLFLMHDTEVSTIFSSILEVPDTRIRAGVGSLQQIHTKMSAYYRHVPSALREIETEGVPAITIQMLKDYYKGNNDPVYQLSIIACIILLAYVKVYQNTNRS
jgi:hypothetical protein